MKPAPVPGMVIRYDYLWHDERAKGRVDGAKDRPCAVVVAAPPVGGRTRIVVVPITHTPPKAGTTAIEMPPRVKASLGLDNERSWIVAGELNRLYWDYPGIVPVGTGQWIYGALPEPLLISVQEAVQAVAQAGRLALVNRN